LILFLFLLTYTAIYRFQAFKLIIPKREKEEGRKGGRKRKEGREGGKKEGTVLNNLAVLLMADGWGQANKVNSRHFAFKMIFSDQALFFYRKGLSTYLFTVTYVILHSNS